VLIVALGLWLASELVPGIDVDGAGTLLGAALFLGLVNAVIRPIIIVLTLPITILTLGLFLLVINAGMLALVASLFDAFRIAGLGSALLGSIVVSITGWLASWLIGPRGASRSSRLAGAGSAYGQRGKFAHGGKKRFVHHAVQGPCSALPSATFQPRTFGGSRL
jgi:putative membrane protein